MIPLGATAGLELQCVVPGEYFHLSVEQASLSETLKETGRFFNLNLLRRQVVTVQEQSAIFNVVHIMIVLAAAGCLLALVQNFYLAHETKKVRVSYDKKDYEYAKKLQQQFKNLGL